MTIEAMRLHEEEPAATRWRMIAVETLWAMIRAHRREDGPLIVAVDGRGASGKSTLADRLAATATGCTVVHTDDLAWNEPLFAWFHLLRDGILEPARRRQPVSFVPPAWPQHGRQGTIEIPASTEVLIVEGVGAAHAAVADLLDMTVWMQADHIESERRGIARDLASGVNGDRDETVAFWHTWYSAERAYLTEDRPWRRADVVVAGTPVPSPPRGLLVVADGPLAN